MSLITFVPHFIITALIFKMYTVSFAANRRIATEKGTEPVPTMLAHITIIAFYVTVLWLLWLGGFYDKLTATP